MGATLAILHHLTHPFLGAAEAPLRAAGLELDERDLRRGDALPALDEVDGILSLGGEESVTEIERYPYLVAEAELLGEAVERELPVLGICLGAQLLAHALGAEVTRLPRRTVVWNQLDALAGANGDPLLAVLPRPVPALHWNEDGFALPAGAVELLERAGQGVEAFRAGRCAWGLQFHPDVDAAVLEEWYSAYGGWLAEAGVDEADARAADARCLGVAGEASAGWFGAFSRVVVSEAARTSTAAG